MKTGADRPNMIIESTGEIEYLPISLWFEDENHYHAFVEIDDVNDVKNVIPQMDQVPSEDMDDEDFGMPGLPSAKNGSPISCEIQSRPISRDPNFKEEEKADKKMSEELKEDVLIASGDFADFVEDKQ